MHNPIKERVFVLLLKELSASDYGLVCATLRKIVADDLSDFSFKEKRLNIPQVKRPHMTTDGSEPDWSQLRLFVKRICIFEDETKHLLIQIANNFLSVNAIAVEDDDEMGIETFEELLKLYKSFMSAIQAEDSLMHLLKPYKLKSETLYVFDDAALDTFVIDRNNTGKRDYLDIRQFLHPGIIPKIETVEMIPPLEMKAHYMVRTDNGIETRLEASLNIDYRSGEVRHGWEFMFELTIDSSEAPTVENCWGAEMLLLEMEDTKNMSIVKFLTESAIEKMGVAYEH